MSNESIISTCSGLVSGLRSAEAHSKPSSRRLLGDLEHPGDVLRHLGPNWYASIMGTGIVANAAALLPVHIPGLRSFALGVWLLAAGLFLGLTLATAVHWLCHPGNARVPKRNSELSVSRGLSADDVVPLEFGEWEVPSDSEANSCFHCGAVISPTSAKMREPLQCGTGRSCVSRCAPLDRPTA